MYIFTHAAQARPTFSSVGVVDRFILRSPRLDAETRFIEQHAPPDYIFSNLSATVVVIATYVNSNNHEGYELAF